MAKKNNIDAVETSQLAIRCRVDRQSLDYHHLVGGQVPPVIEIEPIVFCIILHMAQFSQCQNPSKGLELVNSIIECTKVKDELKI